MIGALVFENRTHDAPRRLPEQANGAWIGARASSGANADSRRRATVARGAAYTR